LVGSKNIPFDLALNSKRTTSKKDQNNRYRGNGEAEFSRIGREHNYEKLTGVSNFCHMKHSAHTYLHGHAHKAEKVDFQEADKDLIVLVHRCSNEFS